MTTTTTGTLPLFQHLVHAPDKYHDAIWATVKALEALPVFGLIHGDIRIECVQRDEVFTVTIWRA